MRDPYDWTDSDAPFRALAAGLLIGAVLTIGWITLLAWLTQ